MINVNVTLLIQMANVLLLVFLMNLILYRPIRRIVAQRKEFMEGRQREIDSLDAQVLSAEQELNARIVEARKLGRQKIQEQKAAAYDEEKDLLQRATEAAGKQLQAMRGQIQQDIGAAREQLQSQIKMFSMDLAQKILGRSL